MVLEKLNAAEKLLVEGKLEEALQITKELKKKETLPKNDLLNSLILKSKILLELKKNRRSSQACRTNFGKAPRSWALSRR